MPPRWFWICLLFALVTAQRLGELWLSHRRFAPEQRAARARLVPEPGYGWMVALHTAWLLGGFAEGLLTPPATSYSAQIIALQVTGAVLWAVALGLRVWFLRALGPLWHVRVVARTTQPVVTSGPYRYIRHPNYLAVVLEIAAVPLLAAAPATAILGSLGNALVLWRRIRVEEAYLLALPAYREAFAAKARFIPGVF